MTSGSVSAIVAVVGLLLTIAALLGTWKVSRNTANVKLYRETAQAWEAKAKAQEAEIQELQARDAAKEKELMALRTQVAVLQDTVTGKTALDALEARTLDILDLVKQTNELVKNPGTLICPTTSP